MRSGYSWVQSRIAVRPGAERNVQARYRAIRRYQKSIELIMQASLPGSGQLYAVLALQDASEKPTS